MPVIEPPRLAQLLFPKDQPHLQRRGLRHFLTALLVGAIAATAVACIMVHLALKH